MMNQVENQVLYSLSSWQTFSSTLFSSTRFCRESGQGKELGNPSPFHDAINFFIVLKLKFNDTF